MECNYLKRTKKSFELYPIGMQRENDQYYEFEDMLIGASAVINLPHWRKGSILILNEAFLMSHRTYPGIS